MSRAELRSRPRRTDWELRVVDEEMKLKLSHIYRERGRRRERERERERERVNHYCHKKSDQTIYAKKPYWLTDVGRTLCSCAY